MADALVLGTSTYGVEVRVLSPALIPHTSVWSTSKWRNRQTHQLEGLALERAWGFKSPLRHQEVCTHYRQSELVNPGLSCQIPVLAFCLRVRDQGSSGRVHRIISSATPGSSWSGNAPTYSHPRRS